MVAFHQRTRKSNHVLWQKQLNQGSNTETLTLPSFTGPDKTPFRAPGGISVQIPEGDFKSQVSALTTQPGMAYLTELTARSDVNWQPVKLAFDQWNYQQEGLTPAGAALLGVAVAWAMPAGVGANLIGAKSTTSALMANAALTSLAAQASIAFVNNKGDVGKTLKELGSSQTVKATIAAALTAGVLDKLRATGTMKELSGKTGFSEKLTYNLINATGRALTNTAINGGSLEDALKSALLGGLVDTAHGQAASAIKTLEGEYLAHKLAHALAGCVAGAAAGGACRDGAVGAAVGEIVAQTFTKPGATATAQEVEAFNNRVLATVKLVAGAAAAYAGGNAQTAITTAETAVRTNYLTDTQKVKTSRELAACENLGCAAGVVAKYAVTDAAQDAALMIGVGGGIGYQSFEQAAAVVDMVKNWRATATALNALLTDADFRARVGEQVADDYRGRIDMLVKAYNDGGWGGAVTAGVEAGRLATDIVGVATAAVGAGKVGATVARVGSTAVVDAFNLTSQAAARWLDAAAESLARMPSNLGAIRYFKDAEEVNRLMSANVLSPAWKEGTKVAEVTLKPGTRVQMVVDTGAYEAKRSDNLVLLDAYGHERLRLSVPWQMTGSTNPDSGKYPTRFIGKTTPWENPATGEPGHYGVLAWVEYAGDYYFELDYRNGEFLWCKRLEHY
jgi:filamentous hemagglutinin